MNRTAVEEIKERIAIEDLIGQYVKLEKSGKSFKAKCPFHNEKSASFFVSPDRGGYYCFGCNAKGDIFTFVEQFEGLDFRGALKVLAEKAGVVLTNDKKADGERDRLFDIMADAVKYFQERLAASPEALAYVEDRGITIATRDMFRIGWAPEGWQNLIDHLRGRSWPDALIEKAGLGKKTEEGKFYDRFRGRIMFPISDSSGRVIAFSGRILPRLDDGKAAKYLNSPDTPLYDKSQVLYGLDLAKTEIRRLNYSIFVEGQMDLVMSHQAGIRNAVASSGTALADETSGEGGAITNLGLVRRLSPNLIIAFDSDTAGRKAAMRAAGIALGLGMDVKMADLVGGKDPADLVRADPEGWRNALRDAKPIIAFELGNVLREFPDPRKASRALRERVFPFVLRIESTMDRAHWVKMIAESAHIQEEAVWEDLRQAEKKQREQAPQGSSSSTAATKQDNPRISRLDLVERRMFGLLAVLERDGHPRAPEFREAIQKAAGSVYAERCERVKPIEGDLIFEAESTYASDKERVHVHMADLIANFERDIISEQLIVAMQELRVAERSGDQAMVASIAARVQELSLKKAAAIKM